VLIVAAFVVLTLVWGTTWAAIRVGLTGLPPLWGVSLRFGLASLLLLALAPLWSAQFGRTPRERLLWLVNAVTAYGIPYVAIYRAEQTIPSGLAAVLFATYPLFVALGAHAALPGERLTPRSLAGVAIGFTGVALLFSEDFAGLFGPGAVAAAGIALAAPLSASAASVMVKRFGAGVSPLSLTAIPMALTAIALAPAAYVAEGTRSIALDAVSVGALVYLAVCGTALTFVLYFWLLARMPASRLALVAYLTPVVAVVTGALAFGEPVTLRMGSGAGLVIAGVALAAGRLRPRPRPARRVRS
jgi:drug/metabolite transporter (DMT)-like permease